jgi:hypothetical protein
MLRAKRRIDEAVQQQIDILKFMREKFGEAAVQDLALREGPDGEAVRHALRMEREADPSRN